MSRRVQKQNPNATPTTIFSNPTATDRRDLNNDEDGHRQHGREKEDVLDEGLDVFGIGNRDADADEDDLDEHEAEAPDERFQDASTDRLLFASQRVFESAHG